VGGASGRIIGGHDLGARGEGCGRLERIGAGIRVRAGAYHEARSQGFGYARIAGIVQDGKEPVARIFAGRRFFRGAGKESAALQGRAEGRQVLVAVASVFVDDDDDAAEQRA
jgi:hypothetical protein